MTTFIETKMEQGKRGEKLAEVWLKDRGFQILRQNWRSSRKWQAGEVDILAKRTALELWLIEVKCHQAKDFALLGAAQLSRLRRSARLLKAEVPGFNVRIALLWVEPKSEKIEWLENP